MSQIRRGLKSFVVQITLLLFPAMVKFSYVVGTNMLYLEIEMGKLELEPCLRK